MCDIQYLTLDLRIIPFCSLNVIPEWYRDKIQQKYGLPIEAWEAKIGEKLEDGRYLGTAQGHAPRWLRLRSRRAGRGSPHPANYRDVTPQS